jgi:prepilin-type N-terminal cleavage/methylation domain-containing protein
MNRLRRLRLSFAPGFTLLEMMIASFMVTIVVVAALSVYSRSNKTASDQQQLTQVQQDVRAAMYYVTRDVRMAGMSLREEFRMAAIEGWDNEDQGGEVRPDRLRIMGNVDLPFAETIVTLNGSGLKIGLNDYSLTQYPYADSDYCGKIILLLPGPGSSCTSTALREITDVQHTTDGLNVWINFTHGRAQNINPPGGLNALCSDEAYIGGAVLFADVREYWLDVTGNAPGLTAGLNGYIGDGVGGVLYLMYNGVLSPIAQNIENLQFQYNGDLDANGTLDGFTDWNSSWTAAQRAKIREVRIWVLGRTPGRFANIPAFASRNTSLYRRPDVANSAAATSDDWHKRFLLDSTANIRNMSLDIYNKDQR